MKRLAFLFLVILLVLSRPGFSQELNCSVTISTSSIQGTNKDVFNTLQDAIRDFMNNTVWTNNVFEANERIECNLLCTAS